MGDAGLALVAAAALPRRPVIGLRLVVQPRAVVEEVLPRALGAARAEALELVDHVVRPLGLDEGDDLVLARARRRAHEVHERVRVRRDEVHRPVRQALVGQRRAHGRPPAPGQPRVAGLRAAEHPQAQVELAVADLVDEPGQAVGPGLAHARPVLLRAAAAPRRRRAARGRRAARPRAAARAACSTRAGRRRASGSRRRGRTSRPAAPRACRAPESYQRRRRAGASAASQSSIRPSPAFANASDSWPDDDHARLARSTPAGAEPSTGTRRGRAAPCRARASAGSSSSRRATARARAAASRPTTAAASCTCGGRARPRPRTVRRPGAATRRGSPRGRGDVGRP